MCGFCVDKFQELFETIKAHNINHERGTMGVWRELYREGIWGMEGDI